MPYLSVTKERDPRENEAAVRDPLPALYLSFKSPPDGHPNAGDRPRPNVDSSLRKPTSAHGVSGR
jgi:hypothetical protein